MNFLKKLFSKNKTNIYKNRICVYVPKDYSELVAGRGNLITVSVTDDVYMAYLYHDENGYYEGVATDCRGCDTVKNGDIVRFHLKGYALPVADVDF